MGTALLVGFDETTASWLRDQATLREVEFLPAEGDGPLSGLLAARGASLDAVLVGERAPDPIAVARAAHLKARDASVLLLPGPERMSLIQQALATAPYVGTHVRCGLPADRDALLSDVRGAIEATGRRRAYRRTLEALSNQATPSTAVFRPQPTHVLDRLLQLAPVGILATDGEGRVTVANPAALSLLGEAPALVGTSASDLFSGPAREGWQAATAEAGGGRSLQLQLTRVRHGAEQVVDIVLADLPSGEGSGGLLVILQDATVRAEVDRQREASVRQLNEALRLRDEFLAVAAHELRTPLTPLTLNLQSIQRRLEAAPQPLRRALATAERQTHKLAQLIDGLLDVSRLTAGKLVLRPEPMDLVEVVQEGLTQHRQQAEDAGCSLELEAPTAVCGIWDRLRMDQVFTVLLSNALKYGQGTGVRIQVYCEAATAFLHVSDRGIGIAPEDQTRIFQRFERAASEQNYGGLGLGLFIAASLVEAMGGRISVRSAPNQGARFSVALPLEPAP